MYHSESVQEDFLVLSGACVAIVEGEEVPLKAWDVLHCPPWTLHGFANPGDGPCAILCVGARIEAADDQRIRYPVSEVALRHEAGASEEATSGKVAYAGTPKTERGPYSEGLPDF